MIHFEKISKNFKSNKILNNITFSIDTGQLVAIIGESGCGKTTLLKMINRLIKPSSGNILINNKNITDFDEVKLRRKIGYVIQQTGLFPHMSVKENIELIQRLENTNTNDIEENTKKLLKMVGLDENTYIHRYPRELSGGQQQRVGIARAFATNPEIILMDEPFSALDPITRSDLQEELLYLQSKLKKTIVFVTHDMDEAIKIADKICIMKDGEILQYDTPENILKNPIDDFVSNFIGKNRIWSSPEFIKISDIMIDKPVTISKELSILKCLDKMRHQKVDSLLVTDPETNKLLGLLKASQLRGVENKSLPAESYMITHFPRLSPDKNILDALNLSEEEHLSTIPVTNSDDCLLGLITRACLVTALSQQYFDLISEVDKQ